MLTLWNCRRGITDIETALGCAFVAGISFLVYYQWLFLEKLYYHLIFVLGWY